MEISSLMCDAGEVNRNSRKLDVDERIPGPNGEWWIFDKLKCVALLRSLYCTFALKTCVDAVKYLCLWV